MTHDELKAKALQNPEVRAAYEALKTEFTLPRELLRARHQAGLSQAEVAKRMGTKASAVVRLEGTLSNGKHSPSLATLQRFARAVGCELQVKLVKPRRTQSKASVEAVVGLQNGG